MRRVPSICTVGGDLTIVVYGSYGAQCSVQIVKNKKRTFPSENIYIRGLRKQKDIAKINFILDVACILLAAEEAEAIATDEGNPFLSNDR